MADARLNTRKLVLESETVSNSSSTILRRPRMVTSVFSALETARAVNVVQEALNAILAGMGGVHV